MLKNLLIIFTLLLFFSCEEGERANRPYWDLETPIANGDGNSNESVVPTRPSDAVFIQANSCACKNGKPTILGNCESFCASKPNTDRDILYLSVKLSEAIELSDLKDLYGWCSTVLTDPETGAPLEGQGNPGCVLEARDEQNSLRASIQLEPQPGSKNLSIDISQKLDSNKNYRLTIKEISSEAKSNTVQIYTYNKGNVTVIPGPLWLTPVSQYTCFARVVSQNQNTGNMYFDDAYRLNFYFIEKYRPDPIVNTQGSLFCHDIFSYGLNDNEIFPRLEETSNSITLWDQEDPRFYDLTGGENNTSNGVIDINDVIYQNLLNQGATISGSLNIFYPFSWPGAPETNANAGVNTAGTPLGYYMVPWIDKTTNLSYCPTENHYYSSSPIFKAMKDIVGVDTEGLYIAKKEAQTVANPDGTTGVAPENYILIRESKVKKIWFYIENGVHYKPTESNIRQKKIQFYWPADESTPFVKKSHQRIYTVKSAQDLQNAGANVSNNGGLENDGVRNTYPPHDRKIGCIPKAL